LVEKTGFASASAAAGDSGREVDSGDRVRARFNVGVFPVTEDRTEPAVALHLQEVQGATPPCLFPSLALFSRLALFGKGLGLLPKSKWGRATKKGVRLTAQVHKGHYLGKGPREQGIQESASPCSSFLGLKIPSIGH
jgi:hypothetical protein